jgi:hypothetical protein
MFDRTNSSEIVLIHDSHQTPLEGQARQIDRLDVHQRRVNDNGNGKGHIDRKVKQHQVSEARWQR